MSNSHLSAQFRRQIRILIVADGLIHFSETTFGLSEFISKGLSCGVNPWSALKITTARRFKDEDKCTDNPDFRFDDKSSGLEQYDQIWLFGQLGEEESLALDDSEVQALFTFMNGGGGVFATGDHMSLGAAMCGKIPRVRSMRKWYYKYAPSPAMKAPGQEDNSRLDTLQVGDPGFQMDDQCDSIPQHIRPKFFREPCGSGSYPHPLLAGRRSPITVLPDHMHEGECIVPKNLNERFTADGRAFDEYPMLPETKQRLVPEVVALATSAAGYWVGLMGNDVLPVEPRCFKAIVAYEGDRVVVDGRRIGRVVVDSSFHHFVDINLRGTGSNDPDKRGFYDHNGNPTRDYEAFKQYYRNIVKWLCPPRLRMELYHSLLLDLRFNSFLLEEIRPVSDPNWKDILHAGIVTRKAIVERFSNAEAIQCCTSLLTNIPPPLALAIESIINPWLPSSLSGSAWPNAINQSFFLNAVLGIAMLAIATELPDDRHRAAERLGEASTPTEVLSAIIAKNSKEAMAQISSVLDRSRQRLGEISAMLLAST